jgi:plastocyanin
MSPLRALVLPAVVVALAAAGTTTIVSQRAKQFSETAIAVHPDDAVRFDNDDIVTHNITVRDAAGRSRPGLVQKPGETASITFGQLGQFTVYCLIHPKMRMTVRVQ